MKERLHGVLAGPFRPLSRGGSVAVYLAGDGRHVLKCPLTPAEVIAWHGSDGVALAELSWAHRFAPAGGPDAIAAAILARAWESHCLAAARMAGLTGIGYLHRPGDARAPAILDLGDRRLETVRTGFIIQTRVTLTAALLERHGARADMPACRRIIDDIITAIASLWAAGIAERGLNFHNNSGYARGRFHWIDTGDFEADPDLVARHGDAGRIVTRKSYRWLAARFPELADYLAARAGERLAGGNWRTGPYMKL